MGREFSYRFQVQLPQGAICGSECADICKPQGQPDEWGTGLIAVQIPAVRVVDRPGWAEPSGLLGDCARCVCSFAHEKNNIPRSSLFRASDARKTGRHDRHGGCGARARVGARAVAGLWLRRLRGQSNIANKF